MEVLNLAIIQVAFFMETAEMGCGLICYSEANFHLSTHSPMKPTTCKHFTGIQTKCCEAGIDYDTHGHMLPCLLIKGERLGKCDKLEFQTPEEVAASEAEMEEFFVKMRLVEDVVNPLRKEGKKNGYSRIHECPACKGKLHIAINSFNGHARVHCETEGCVRWIE